MKVYMQDNIDPSRIGQQARGGTAGTTCSGYPMGHSTSPQTAYVYSYMYM